MDALSEVLRAVRLSGATILNADFGAPWAVSAGSSSALAKGFLSEADTPAVFHLVVEGECCLQTEAAEPIALRTGDLALLAHGNAHRLCDALESSEVSLVSLVKPSIAGELAPIVHGGTGPRTRIITGLVAIDRSLADPLFAALPDPPLTGDTTEAAWGPWLTLLRGDGLAGDDPRALVVRKEFEGKVYGSGSATLVAISADGVRYDFTATPATPQWTPVELPRPSVI